VLEKSVRDSIELLFLLALPCSTCYLLAGLMSARRILACIGLGAILTPLTAAQEPTCLNRTIAVNALDEAGFRLPAVSPSDFKGEFRGKPVRIVSLTPDERPRRIRILLDTSSSMLGQASGKWPVALRVAQDIVNSFPLRYQISLYTFSTAIELALDSASREALLAQLQKLASGNKALHGGLRRTALFDSIHIAIAGQSPLERGDVLYVITDGEDNRSQESMRVLESELLSKGIRLFAFLFDESWLSLRESGPKEFVEMVRVTGGEVAMPRPDPRPLTPSNSELYYHFITQDFSTLDRLLLVQFRLMASYDSLQIVLPERVDKPRSWKLTRASVKGSPHKETPLAYPKKLLPCDAGKVAGAPPGP
jgi:von Willebrand factor type A domain-containing protein